MGPGLHALPRTKLLSFRFLGTPRRHRLGLVCMLCLVSMLSQVGGVSYHILGRGCVSGAKITPFQLWLPATCLPVSSGGSAGPQLANSPLVFAQSFVL